MQDIFPLSLLPSGERARIEQVVGQPDEVHRLQELGMSVGTAVEMVQAGSPCIVKLGEARLAFRDNEAIGVLVRTGEVA
jgi:ferrous iron transport protein A